MNKNRPRQILRFYFFLLCLLCPALGAAAQVSPLWGDLQKGIYPVGYKTFRYFDAARATRPAVNYDGSAFTGERRRVVDVQLWYPGLRPKIYCRCKRFEINGQIRTSRSCAEPRPGVRFRRMNYEDYLFSAPAAADRPPTEAEKTRRREAFIAQNGGGENAARFLNMPVEAAADYPPAPGKFPLIVGFSISRTLAEFLASNGYTVAVVTSPTASDNQLADYVGDLEFAVNRLAEIPSVDVSRIGATGFSASAGVAALFQMKTGAVAAVVSFDGVEAWNQWREQLARESYFRPAAANVPYLRFNDAEHPAGDVNFSFFYERAPFMELIRIDYKTFGHRDMENAVFERLIPRDGAPIDYLPYQKLLGEYTLNLFDARIKNRPEAAAFLTRSPEENGFPKDFAGIARKAAAPRPPGRAEIAEILENRGAAAFVKLARELRKNTPQPFAESLLRSLLLVYGRQRRHEIALPLAELFVESYPELSTTYYFAGSAYRAGQQPAQAVKYFERFLEIEKTDAVTSPATKERLRALVVQNLEELKKTN